MTRLSNYLLPTLKDAPADAEATSHKLMVRAGLVRQLGTAGQRHVTIGAPRLTEDQILGIVTFHRDARFVDR